MKNQIKFSNKPKMFTVAIGESSLSKKKNKVFTKGREDDNYNARLFPVSKTEETHKRTGYFEANKIDRD